MMLYKSQLLLFQNYQIKVKKKHSLFVITRQFMYNLPFNIQPNYTYLILFHRF